MTVSGGKLQRSTRASNIALWVVAVSLVAVVAMPWWGDRAALRLATEILYYLALAQMWNLLAGYGGLVSIGQQAFVGFGGYTLFVCVVYAGLSPLAAIPLGGVVAALVALPSAFLLFRLRGAYFAVGSWVLAEVFLLSFAQIEALGGGSGMSLPLRAVRSIARSATERDSIVLWIAVALCVLSLVVVVLLLRSRIGLALMANRDDPIAAEGAGVNVVRVKLVVFLVAAAITGLIGALIFLTKLRISPAAGFDLIDWTANVIFIVVIGGVGRVEGPFVGVAVFFVLRFLLADLGTWYLIVLGLAAILVMVKSPGGIWGLIVARWDIQLAPVQRRLSS